jgi:hypothetical protein
MTSMRQWLDSIGLGQYTGAFEKHSVDWDVLEKLNHSLLKDIGVISAGDRIRLLSAIKELGSREDKKTETTTIRETSALSASSDDAQRRQLTVLFCDIVGYTDLAHRLDPEDLRDLTISYQNVCGSAIRRIARQRPRYVQPKRVKPSSASLGPAPLWSKSFLRWAYLNSCPLPTSKHGLWSEMLMPQ